MDNINLIIKKDFSVEINNLKSKTTIQSNLIECLEKYYKNNNVNINIIKPVHINLHEKYSNTHDKLINLLDSNISNKHKIQYSDDFFEAQICVPYRSQGNNIFRKNQLFRFIKHIKNYMHISQPNIKYRIVIIEQNNSQPFNRGFLLNIGFVECENIVSEYIKYYIHHNCDLFPDINYILDYSYPGPDVRDHFGFEEGLGGICVLNRNLFKLINGFPNNCLGWSTEDEIIKQRCERFNIKVNRDENYNKRIKEENHERNSSFQKLNQINTSDDNINWKRNGLSSLLYKCKIKQDSEFKIHNANINLIHYLVDFNI